MGENDGNIFGEVGGGGVDEFLDLTDVDETTYTGHAGEIPTVNAGETALEFIALAGGGNVSSDLNITDHALVRGDGGLKKIQESGIIVSDLDEMTNVTTINGVTIENHSARHESGGADEINVAGLSGELADDQPAKSHDNTKHSTPYLAESTFDAQSLVIAVVDNTPVVQILAEQQLVGRLTGGNITAVSIGISDDNIVQIDSATVADNDYAKFTANGLEGRTYSEVMGDLSGTAAADFSMNTNKITNLSDPTAAQDAATKAYTDSVAQGLNVKSACACATTANISLVDEQTIDGVATASSRVLVKDQTDPTENGIYVSAVGAWARATDMDADDEVASSFVFVTGGTTNSNTGWVCTNEPESVEIGVDGITFSQFSDAGYIDAGTGLTKSGNQLAVTDVLEDLIALGAPSADGEFIVATGAGAFAYESGATARTSLGLAIGTDVLAYDAGLQDLAGVAMAADKFYYTTADNTHAAATVTSFARSILDDPDEATFKATVNLEIGVDVLAQQTIGIADDNLVEIDSVDVASGEIARFTANGLESRSNAEMKTQLGYMTDLSDDASPTLGAELEVGEYGIKFDEALSADGTWSGIVCDGVLGDTIAFGDLLYLATADQRWEKADADAETTAGDVMLAIALEAGIDGDTKKLLLRGFVREDDWAFTSYGQALYVSATAGSMTQTAPSTTGQIVRVVGYAHDNADTIYFDPEKGWVEIA